MESRAFLEAASIGATSPLLSRLPGGDGHPVLVLPGFTAGDPSTAPLRRVLRNLGYWTYGWGLGNNFGPTPEVIDGLGRQLRRAHDRDGRAVSLIGWSLGGIYAREMAREQPGMVRQVITLGTPFRQTGETRSPVGALYEQFRPLHVTDRPVAPSESQRPPLQVPATAVYTRTDGVVRWWNCIESEGPKRETIRVLGSHSGLGYNPAVIYAVADRLAQPVGQWRPFQAPRWARPCFPPSETWRERAADRVA